MPLRSSSEDPKKKKPPKLREKGWRVFVQSYEGDKFIYMNRSQLPEEEKEKLDSDADLDETLQFIIEI